MSTRTVRLDDEAERALAALQKATGPSVSGVLRRGLHAYARIGQTGTSDKPYEICRSLNAGLGNGAIWPATNRMERVSETIRKEYGRQYWSMPESQ